MSVDAEFARSLAQIFKDRGAVGDSSGVFPGPEWVSQGEHVGVGADPGVAEQIPCAANLGAGFKNDIPLAGAPCLQAVASANAGEAGTDDDNIEVGDKRHEDRRSIVA